jgi:hypothetical protein
LQETDVVYLVMGLVMDSVHYLYLSDYCLEYNDEMLPRSEDAIGHGAE